MKRKKTFKAAKCANKVRLIAQLQLAAKCLITTASTNFITTETRRFNGSKTSLVIGSRNFDHLITIKVHHANNLEHLKSTLHNHLI